MRKKKEEVKVKKQGRYRSKDNVVEILVNMLNYLDFAEYYFDGVSIQIDMIDDKAFKSGLKDKLKSIDKGLLMLRSELEYLKDCKKEEDKEDTNGSEK